MKGKDKPGATDRGSQSTANGHGWHTLVDLLIPQRTRLLIAIAMTLLAVTCELLPYWILFQAVDVLLSLFLQSASFSDPAVETQYNVLLQLAGSMALALLLKTVFYSIAYFLSHQSAFSVLAETRKTLVSQLAQAPLPWIEQHSSGQLKQAVLQDVEQLETLISHHTVEVIAALTSPLLITLFLLWIDWRLALAALACAPLAVMAALFFMQNTRSQYDQYNQAVSALNSTTVEYLRTIPVMKVFRQDTENFQVMREKLHRYYTLTASLTKKTVPGWALFSSLLGANMLFILPTGIWLYTESAVSLTQIMMVVILGSGMLKPLLKVSRFFMEVNEVLASVRRLEPILTLNTEHQKLTHHLSAPVTVKFEHIGFSYGLSYGFNDSFYENFNESFNDSYNYDYNYDYNYSYNYDEKNNGEPDTAVTKTVSETAILKNINFTLSPGSFTVLLGPSGTGKSTLSQLLSGLLIPDTGRITINGVPVEQLSNGERASLIAVVTQDIFLFKGTLRDNICLAKPHASEQDIQTALKGAQAEHLIATLPQGLDTQIHEQGIRLSGGERQRITIARALLADTPVLVLDEATASLDNRTQHAVHQSIKKHYPEKTLLVISHRNDRLESADQILVLNNQQIEATGSHQNLLASNGFYRTLWQYQSASDNWSIRTNNPVQEVADD